MKILHISALHFRKKLHGFSLIDNRDQPFWAEQFLKLVDEKAPDVILIAGDVYDNGNPGREAISLLSDFLTSLLVRGIPVMMVAGNHDSGERLAFLSNVLDQNGLYIAGQLEREMKHVTLRDEIGDVTYWLLPFVFPSLVSDVLDDPTIKEGILPPSLLLLLIMNWDKYNK
ncbi:MAG: exonuclease subunit SbcD [Oscillospiraceae bacterium]|nr:exonuclease subunit SbcD [Oscillospiraceae bacterium]